MADVDFTENLVKLVAAQMQILVSSQVAQDMFGKSYHALGNMEKIAVDQAAMGMTAANYNILTPEYLRTQPQIQQPVGFVAPTAPPKEGS